MIQVDKLVKPIKIRTLRLGHFELVLFLFSYLGSSNFVDFSWLSSFVLNSVVEKLTRPILFKTCPWLLQEKFYFYSIRIMQKKYFVLIRESIWYKRESIDIRSTFYTENNYYVSFILLSKTDKNYIIELKHPK